MDNPRYLPAECVKAGTVGLCRLSVRARSGHEIGKLVGFVIDAHHIRSLVVQSGASTLEIPMGFVQFDSFTRSLRLHSEDVEGKAFAADSVPQISADDLWVPLFHSAA